MDEHELDEPPCTVTASYSVSLRRPTPTGTELHVEAYPEEIGEDRSMFEWN